MKTLIIPDVHYRLKNVKKFLSVKPDRIIFLGDLFDSREIVPTPSFLEEYFSFLHSLNAEFLFGNHDLQYAAKINQNFLCSGYNPSVKAWADHNLSFDNFKLFTVVDGWVLSHAGMNPRLFCHPVNGFSIEYATSICDKALEEFRLGNRHPILNAGWSRMGNQPVGGIVWQDWSEFVPIEGVNQIVGHTFRDSVRVESDVHSENWCIDTGTTCAILDDGLFFGAIDGDELVLFDSRGEEQ